MDPNSRILLSGRFVNDKLQTTVETYVCLFTYIYCDMKHNMCFVDEKIDYYITVHTKIPSILQKFRNESYEDQEIKFILPAVETDDKQTFIAGLCGVLRWAIKSQLLQNPDHYSQSLLGFRGGCLVSCSESSMWTKFCEIQLPSAVSVLATLKRSELDSNKKLSETLMLLEAHLKRPVRTHNILKRKLDLAKKIKRKEIDPDKASDVCVFVDTNVSKNGHLSTNDIDICSKLQNLAITEKTEEFSLNHHYLEGIDLTLADIITYPCINYLLNNISSDFYPYLEKVIQWHERMSVNELVKNATDILQMPLFLLYKSSKENNNPGITIPQVIENSLYKRDPFHSKLKCKHQDPKDILMFLENSSIIPKFITNYCTTLDWERLPTLLHPVTGDLPQKRANRKCEQIESMVTAVLSIAIDGQTIVEFCAGGGHVGLLLAYFLPNCKIILIENKESSLIRARNRATSLNLQNIVFCQCNLDYFKGSFDIGVSLHACGVATDLIIQQCINVQASFVSCPCCYGGVQNTHLLKYPLSNMFQRTGLTYEKYVLLAHCADRNEVNTPTAPQGELCMSLIDSDRSLYAEEHGYEVILTTLKPVTCSPKHNLLIGKSLKWKKTQ